MPLTTEEIGTRNPFTILNDGSVTAPSLAFVDDRDTGLYRIGSGIVGVASNGVEVVRFGSGATVATGVVFNDGSADIDFRIESNGNANMFVVDAGTDTVGIGGLPHSAGTTTLAINGYTTANTRLGVQGNANEYAITAVANSTAGQAFGLQIRGGTNASDFGLSIRDQPNNTVLFTVSGLGTITTLQPTPASVGTTPGTNQALVTNMTGGLGGNTTIGTTGVAGNGGGFTLLGGAGGVATAATTAATGGIGGAFSFTSGAGGAEAVAGVTSTGGASGAITFLSGDGGAVSGAVSGTATGGRAGIVTLRGGVGGAVTATTGTNVGGIGGDVSVIAGAGGAASGATDTGGRGGIITLTPGAGGTGDTNGAPGYISRTAGITRRQIQTIGMNDGPVTLTLVPGTPTGTLMTSDILYVDAESGTTENLLLPPEADLTGAIIIIVNTGGETINIQNDAGGAVLTLETLNTAIITCDGTTLRGIVGVP